MLHFLYKLASILILLLIMQWPFIQINAMLSTTNSITANNGNKVDSYSSGKNKMNNSDSNNNNNNNNHNNSNSNSNSNSNNNSNSDNVGNFQYHQSNDCMTNSIETSLYCRGARVMRNIINNLSKTDKPIVIVRGLEIVPAHKNPLDMGNDADNATSANSTFTTNNENEGHDTLIGRFSTYLRTHELNIKFSDLLAEESERYLARDLMRNGIQINGSMVYPANGANGGNANNNAHTANYRRFGKSVGVGVGVGVNGVGEVVSDVVSDIGSISDGNANNLYDINVGSDASEGKGKKEKGNGMMMMMAVMFSKLLAVMGMGGIGALALKALGVALVALVVAGIIGLRSMMSSSYDSTPSVHYVQAEGQHHHRRRRSKNFGIITIPNTNDMKHKIDGNDLWNPQPLAYSGWQHMK